MPTLDPAGLPARMTRAKAAAYVTQHYFPISPRTLETVAFPSHRKLGNRVLIDTVDIIAFAEAKLKRATLKAAA